MRIKRAEREIIKKLDENGKSAARADSYRESKEYWEEQAISSDDPLKIVRTLAEDTPEFILKILTEFEIDVTRFCFDGHPSLILDVGCGTGNILMHALELYPESSIDYTGLDFSENILRKAIARVKKSNVSFIQGNMGNLPFKDNTFDRVICSGVIWYLPSPDEAVRLIRECHRVLKPEEALIIDFLNKFSPSIMVTSLLHRVYTKPPSFISPFWFIRELKKAGFKITSYRGFNFGLFTGYRYLFMGKYKIFDPYFMQERWSRFIEKKIVHHIDKVSLLGHRIYVKCKK